MQLAHGRVSVDAMRQALRRISALDIAIAAAVTLALELEVWSEDLTPTIAALVCFAALGSSLLLRRVAPLAALVIGIAAMVTAVSFGVSMQQPVAPLLFYVLVLYSVGLREERPRAVAGLAIALGGTFAALVIGHYHGDSF